MAERAATGDERPFFAFVLLDSPHQPYFNPGGPYQPAVESLNYIDMGRVLEGPELADLQLKVENTYRNSVLHADRVAGDMMRSLEAHGQLDDTVVCVTGDHGEEFFEHGFWGHTSNFTPEQVHVPFYLKGPGIEPGVETRPTSHLDLSGSLLELLGADPDARGGYTLGESLFAPRAARDRVIGGFYHLGVWTDEGIFNLPLEPARDVLGVYDERWRLHLDVRARLERARPRLEAVAEECHRFLDLE
jgi:membrane-anchored protein YejM (alkaline phosphatase superfamily)